MQGHGFACICLINNSSEVKLGRSFGCNDSLLWCRACVCECVACERFVAC
jgi:hypothetical protein